MDIKQLEQLRNTIDQYIEAKQAQEDKVRERELQTLAKLKAKYGDVS